MAVLGGEYRIHHHRQVAAGGILHAHGNIEAAGHQAVLLVLDAARSHRHIRQQVRQEQVILGVQHLVGAGESALFQCLKMQAAYRHQALEKIGTGNGVGLMQHALVAGTCSAGLIGIDAGHYHNLVCNLVLKGTQTEDIIEHGILAVGRAGANQDGLYLFIVLLFMCGALGAYAVHSFKFLRAEQLAVESHIHITVIYQTGPAWM